MSDRIFFSVAAAAALAMVALALVWPQGEGRRSPGPFGHAAAGAAVAPRLRATVVVGRPPPGGTPPGAPALHQP